MNKIKLTWDGVQGRAEAVANSCLEYARSLGKSDLKVYAVPRGGIPAALLVRETFSTWMTSVSITLVTDLSTADVVIDDLVDSGTTKRRIMEMGFRGAFFALLDKKRESINVWVVFPWEDEHLPWEHSEQGPTDAVVRILQYIGEDPTREGLLETPTRVIKSYGEIFGGYKETPEQHLKTFVEGACKDMVVLKDLEFHSCCEHHMQPFFGKAHIAYVPDQRVVGVSKLSRILDVYARRLQIQERLTDQVVTALMEHLQPKGAACIIEAKHFCMVCRGVRKQNATMVTSALKGVFMEPGNAARAELFSLIRN